MTLLCLWAPHLPVQVALADHPELADQPLVIVGRPWDDDQVLDGSAPARAAGVAAGQRLAAAQSRCPQAVVHRADEDVYATLQNALRTVLRDLTPRVETVKLGLLLADVTHHHALRDNEAPHRAYTHLARRIHRAAQDATALDVRVGVAPQRFTAEQATRATHPHGWAVVLPGEARGFLAPLPLTTLPADAEMLRRLHILGIRTLGDLARLPRRAVIHQFDARAGFLHDLACGKDPRPVHPDAPPLHLTRTHTWEPPVRRRGPLDAQVARLLQGLAVKLQRTGYQVQGLRISLAIEAGQPLTETCAVEPPTADGERLTRRALTLLARMRPAAGITALTLTLYPLRPAYLGATQLALFQAPRTTRRRQLQETLRRLRQRFGELIIQVAALVAPPPPRALQVVQDHGGTVRTLVWPDHMARVARIYEHWRVHRRWWGQPVRRDYYRLETADGRGHTRVRTLFHDLETDRWWLERRSR
jgi:DNA polymerase-4